MEPVPTTRESTVDKSPHTQNVKKTGKSIKEKRADKRAKVDVRAAVDAVSGKVAAGKHR